MVISILVDGIAAAAKAKLAVRSLSTLSVGHAGVTLQRDSKSARRLNPRIGRAALVHRLVEG